MQRTRGREVKRKNIGGDYHPQEEKGGRSPSGKLAKGKDSLIKEAKKRIEPKRPARRKEELQIRRNKHREGTRRYLAKKDLTPRKVCFLPRASLKENSSGERK